MPRPRVSSEFIQSPISSPPAAGIRIPVFIGTAVNTFTVQELITKGSGTADAFAHVATAIIRVGNLSSTVDYTAPTNYALGTGENAGKIVWSTGAPTTGSKYYVTYKYAKATADYAPAYFDNYNTFLSQYGAISLDGNNKLTEESYLTAAVQLCMDIGMNQVVVCQVKKVGSTPTTADFKAAYAKLESPIPGNINPFYFVPLLGVLGDTDFAQSQLDALAHVIKMHDPMYRRRRTLYTGMPSNATVDTAIAKATAVHNSWFVLCPNFDPIRLIATTTGSVSVTLDGCFAAVAAAALRSTQKVTEPALNKIIPGSFTGFATRFSDPQVDNLVDAGTFCLEENAGVISVVDDITTNTVNEIEIDVTTVEYRDVMISNLENRLKAKFQGRAGIADITSEMVADMNLFFGDELSANNMNSVSGVTASRVTGSLRRYIVTFSYTPVGKVRDIDIKFSIDV